MSTIKFISIIKILVQILPHLNDGALPLQETIPESDPLSQLRGVAESVLECGLRKHWFVLVSGSLFLRREVFSWSPAEKFNLVPQDTVSTEV